VEELNLEESKLKKSLLVIIAVVAVSPPPISPTAPRASPEKVS